MSSLVIKRLTLTIIALLLLAGGVLVINFSPGADESNLLKITVFDVGQGDSILIQAPYGQNILIDGGPDNTILEKLNSSLPFSSRQIDLAVLTHPHADHLACPTQRRLSLS